MIFGMMRGSGLISTRRSTIILAWFLLILLLESNIWPAIRAFYIYFFALIILWAKFIGTLRAIQASAEQIEDLYPFFRAATLVVLAAVIMALEFAHMLLTPLLRANVQPMIWRAGTWIIPALGIVMTINDSVRAAIRNAFPTVNPRLTLFLFVLAGGLLVPLYIPNIDQILRGTTLAGIGIGLILVYVRG